MYANDVIQLAIVIKFIARLKLIRSSKAWPIPVYHEGCSLDSMSSGIHPLISRMESILLSLIRPCCSPYVRLTDVGTPFSCNAEPNSILSEVASETSSLKRALFEAAIDSSSTWMGFQSSLPPGRFGDARSAERSPLHVNMNSQALGSGRGTDGPIPGLMTGLNPATDRVTCPMRARVVFLSHAYDTELDIIEKYETERTVLARRASDRRALLRGLLKDAEDRIHHLCAEWVDHVRVGERLSDVCAGKERCIQLALQQTSV